jgi:hypothetical protein
MHDASGERRACRWPRLAPISARKKSVIRWMSADAGQAVRLGFLSRKKAGARNHG